MIRLFKEIQKIPCPETKIAVATCAYPEVLSRLCIAFPECFDMSKDEEEGEPLIGLWSELREVWNNAGGKFSEECDERKLDDVGFNAQWAEALYDMDQAKVFDYGKYFGRERPNIFNPLPAVLTEQLRKVEDLLTDPVIVSFENEEWVASISMENQNHRIGHIKRFHAAVDNIEKGEMGCVLSLFPRHLIIFD